MIYLAAVAGQINKDFASKYFWKPSISVSFKVQVSFCSCVIHINVNVCVVRCADVYVSHSV